MTISARTGLVPWVLGAVGGLALVVQTLMLRELMVSAWGNELVFGIGLACWLAGVGIGAGFGTRSVRRGSAPAGRFVFGLAALPWLGLTGMIWVRLLPVIAATPPGGVPGFGSVLWVAGPAFMLAAVPVGWTFPLGAALYREPDTDGPSVIYAAEGFGALVAGLLLAFLFLGSMASGWILAVASLPVLCLAAVFDRRLRWRAGWLLVVVVFTVLAAFLDTTTAAIRWTRSHAGQRVWERDTPYQRLGLGRMGEQSVLLSNGKPAVTFPDRLQARVTAGRLLSQRPGARNVLVLGMVRPDLVAELAREAGQVTWVLLDQAGAAVLTGALPGSVRSMVHLYFDDSRAWVRHRVAAGKRGYDLVYLADTEPVSLLQARMTTVEALVELSGILSPGGVLALTVPGTVNYLAGDTGQVAAMQLAAVQSVFRYLSVSPESPHWVFASNWLDTVTDRADTVRSRLVQLGDRWWRVAHYVAATFPEERTGALRSWIRGLPPADHRDDRPLLVLRYARLLGWYSGSTIAPLLTVLERLPWIWVVFPFLLAALRWGRGPDRFPVNPTGLTAVAGFSAMTVTLVLLTAFQVRIGTLYREVALINGCFMAGLPVGALAMSRCRGKTVFHSMLPPLLGLLLLAVLLALISPARRMPEWSFYFAALMDGLLTGAVFPAALLAAKTRERSGAVRAGLIDAADHTGAALGALITGAFVVPTMGFRATLLLLVAVLGAVLPVAAGSRRTTGGQRGPSALHSEAADGGAP